MLKLSFNITYLVSDDRQQPASLRCLGLSVHLPLWLYDASDFLLTLRKRRGQRLINERVHVRVCESGHGSCSQGGEDLQRPPERAEESRSRCEGQRERKFEDLDRDLY